MRLETKKAIILDLDNTIYPVSAIGDQLFEPIIDLIGARPDLPAIKQELQRRPFHLVAASFDLPTSVIQQCETLLKNMVIPCAITPFDDYAEWRRLPADRYLVTSGFTKLQWSKIRSLGIEQDFKAIYVIDATTSNLTKKDVFEDIIRRTRLPVTDILVIGDDPNNEIKAAQELGMDYMLYVNRCA